MKIKNLFWGMLAFAGIITMASCQQDDFVGGETAGDYVDATFTVSTADGISTRATIGNGETVNTVVCAVYDAEDVELKNLRKYVSINNKTATYSVRLAKGQEYRVVFFAYNNEGDYYNVEDLKNIEVRGEQDCNVEARDAFTAYYDVTAEATMNTINVEKIELKRPLAQLNLGIDKNELEAAADAGIVIKESYIKVSNVYTAFNAFENVVVGNPTEVEFAMNTIPTEKLEVELNGTEGIQEDEKFTYLALNYLLVGDLNSEKTLTDVEFIWATADGKTNNPTTNFPNVRTQRNYRTNILGKLITNPATFNVVIDERFDGNKNMHYVANEFDLQAAIDAAPVGESTIYVAHDIVGNVTVVQKPGVKITIDGRGKKFNGAIKVHSNSLYYADAALTIKNVNFETSTASVNFIEALENGSERYSSNITVENCTFTATDAAVNTAVGVQVKATRGVTVKNCTATNMHSLIQAQSCDTGDVKVVNCTVNGKNGVAFKQVKSATVEGTTIDAAAYGIRFDGNIDNYGIVVKNNNVKAIQPLIVRKMTAQNNTIALEGNNTLTVSGTRAALDAYQVIITKGSDDEAYVKPTGTYTLTGAENFIVYPRDYYAPVASWDEFTAALTAGEAKIMLTGDVVNETVESFTINQDVVINLNQKAFELTSASAILYTGDKKGSTPKVTFKNGKINNIVYGLSGDLTLTDIVFGGTVTYLSAAQGVINTKSANLLAVNCKMTNVKKSGSTKPRTISVEGRTSGYIRLIDCNLSKFGVLDRAYFWSIGGTTILELKNCVLYTTTMASNIDFSGTYSLCNVDLANCKGGFTFGMNRASTSLTDEEMAVYKAIKKNNSGSMRFLFTDGEKNNL